MLWQIRFFPRCSHHVFLSHCREDRDWLVFPLYETLQRSGIIPWLDCHDYPYGRTSFEALRDGVLKCRHTVFLVTTAMLDQPRGWSIVELAWAELIQENLRVAGATLQTISLPLFFLDYADGRMARSAWHPLRDRAVFHQPRQGDPVDWAARQIQDFVLREAQRAQDLAEGVQRDDRLRDQLADPPGLLDRVTARYPESLTLPPAV